MTAYATAASLALYLGRALTAAETAEAAAACDAATDLIERYTGKTWQGTTITGELQAVGGEFIYLNRSPVTSITSITRRAQLIGETATTLVAGTDYELIDAARGRVLVSASQGSLLTVTYVVTATVPASISLAANMLAAEFLKPASMPARPMGVTRLTADDMTIQWDRPVVTDSGIPADVAALLNLYKRPVVLA